MPLHFADRRWETSIESGQAWPAPAKLNLFLHITGRRADGYHELQTLFQFLDIGDLLDFAITNDGQITSLHQLHGLKPEEDLCWRAARLLQKSTGCSAGAQIHLHKQLPMGGGLGGGSSDAATVLVALNALWDTQLSVEELAALGLSLGADVPIFVHAQAAWAEGVGEHLQAANPPEPVYLVIYPGVHVATGRVFSDPALTRNCPPITMSDFILGRAGNVCEPLVRRLYPEVGAALDWLGNVGCEARMTGTGSCVYAALADQATAQQLLGSLPSRWTGWVARGRNQSPLMDRLQLLKN